MPMTLELIKQKNLALIIYQVKKQFYSSYLILFYQTLTLHQNQTNIYDKKN